MRTRRTSPERRFVGLLFLSLSVALALLGYWLSPAPSSGLRQDITLVLLEEGPLGVEPGCDVVLGGLVIGTVTSTDSIDRRMVLTATVDAKPLNQFVAADSYAMVRRKISGLGGAFIEIKTGHNGDLAEAGYRLPVIVVANSLDQLEAMLPEMQEQLKAITGTTAEMMERTSALVGPEGGINRTLGAVQKLSESSTEQVKAIGESTKASMTRLNTLMDHVQKQATATDDIIKTISEVLKSVPVIGEQIRATLASLERTLEAIRGSGLVRLGNVTPEDDVSREAPRRWEGKDR